MSSGLTNASVLDVYSLLANEFTVIFVNLCFQWQTLLTCCHKVSLVVAVESPITTFWHCCPSSKNVGSSICMTLVAGMSTFWNVGRSCTCLICSTVGPSPVQSVILKDLSDLEVECM